MIALCVLFHVGGFCTSSNITATAISPCMGDPETISFSEAYFTSRAFINQRIKCHGVLTKIKHGPLVLEPVDGEMRDDEHIVHANKWKSIGIHRCKWEEGPCHCNDDETSWRGLNGKTVIVEGVLTESSPSCLMLSEEFMSPVLLDSRITVDGGLSDTNKEGTDETQRVPPHQHASHSSEYASPCQEFKLVVHSANGGRYMIHYYSATLWMAYIGPDRLANITRPFPLYPLIENKRKIRTVWTMLNGLEKLILPSVNNSRGTSVKCLAKRYSQIQSIEIHNPGDELIKSVKDLFHFVYEQQRQRE